MRPHGQKRRTHDQGGDQDLLGFMGSHHHASRSRMSIGLPTCSDQAPPCRFSASITHPRALPINAKLKLHSKGRRSTSLLLSHSPYISYDRRSMSNEPEHRPKPTINTTIKRPCSSGREPDGRDQFLSRPQSFDQESNSNRRTT
ncbi:hypothetical protein ACE6H2_007295 [Prunus campanulata]